MGERGTETMRNLDREKTTMQETGQVELWKPSLAEVMEIVLDLGIDPHCVRLLATSVGGQVVTAKVKDS